MGSAPYTENISVQSTLLKNATWFYFTLNGDEEAETGSWWYYDQEGNIVEKIVL